MSNDIDMNVSEVVSRINLHVKVKGVRRTIIRVKLMIYLMKFATWVGGFEGIAFEMEQSDSNVNEQRHLP